MHVRALDITNSFDESIQAVSDLLRRPVGNLN